MTAVIGTPIIGMFLAWITRKAHGRRADSQLQEKRICAQNKLRYLFSPLIDPFFISDRPGFALGFRCTAKRLASSRVGYLPTNILVS